MIHRDAVVVRGDDLFTAPLGDEVALMQMATGTYFVLDEVAAAIWDRIETPTAVGAICQELRDAYAVAEDRCEADVVQFLEALRLKQLVRVVDGGG
jgi:hypothetical protein